MEQRRNLTGWVFLLPAALLIALMNFWPMIQALVLSFKTGSWHEAQLRPTAVVQLHAPLPGRDLQAHRDEHADLSGHPGADHAGSSH